MDEKKIQELYTQCLELLRNLPATEAAKFVIAQKTELEAMLKNRKDAIESALNDLSVK